MQTTTRLPGTGSDHLSLACEGDCQRVLLFYGDGFFMGPVGTDLAHTSRTWQFNGSDWTPLHPSHTPPLRSGQATATNPRTGQPLLFGGFGIFHPSTKAAAYNDVWTFDGHDWQTIGS